jgi:hypothetical protein
MVYIDLNSVRAKMADTVQNAEDTSIFERIHNKASNLDNKEQLPFTVNPLLGFIGNEHHKSPKGLAFSSEQWLQLSQHFGK